MGKFEMLLERATNSNNLDPDLAAIMEMCDTVRQGDLTPKKAVISVKKKLMDKHTLVSYYTLFVLESLMKNCGPDMHKEILVKEVLGRMQEMVKNPSDFSEKSKEKSLELIQTWNVAFRNDSSYLILTSIYNNLAMAGVRFPEVTTSDAVFITERPPEWKPDKGAKQCTLCQAEFSLTTRRHHCRNCGECFCSRCCSNNTTLPKFGIEREVRVCESCYIKVAAQPDAGAGDNDPVMSPGLPDEYLKSSLFKESQAPPTLDPKREAELKEQEDLDLVIAMSLNEEENKKPTVTFSPHVTTLEPTPHDSSAIGPYGQLLSSRSLPTPPPEVPPYLSHPAPTPTESAEDELAKYYNREYWEGRRDQQGTSSPLPNRRQQASPVYAQIQLPVVSKHQHHHQPQEEQGGDEEEGDKVLAESLQKNLQLFTSLLTDAQTQGRSPATDPSVQSLYGTLNSMHPELLRVMENLERRREQFEALEQKAAMVKEARAALNKSRREYLETVRQQEEQQRLLATMLLEQNIALIRKHQSEQADMGLRLAKERERELREEEERQVEEQRRRRHLVNEHQRMQEQQVVAQHLAQIIPGKFEGNVGQVPHYISPLPSLLPQGTAPLPMYTPPTNLFSGPSSLPASLNTYDHFVRPPPSSLTQLTHAETSKPTDPFSPLNSSQALQESGLNFSTNPNQIPILTQLQPASLMPPTALQQPSSLPILGTSPPNLSYLIQHPHQLHQLSHTAHNPITQPSFLPQVPMEIPLQYQTQEIHSLPQAPIPPQVNQVSMIPPSYAPQLDFYQQSASPVPKEQVLIDFD